MWCCCRTQLRCSFGGVIGLDYNALYLVARTLEIEVDAWVLMMIRSLEGDMVQEANRKMGEDANGRHDEKRGGKNRI